MQEAFAGKVGLFAVHNLPHSNHRQRSRHAGLDV